MLVAHDADGAAVLIQIQLQIKGIDRRGCARRNGMAIFGGGGADGNAAGGGVRADGIAIEIGSIGIACVFQLLRQRIPLELEGMRRAVVHPLNFALPVLGVVDGVAVQRDGLHAPCVGDDSDGIALVAFQYHVIIGTILLLYRFPINSIMDIGTGKDTVMLGNCVVAKAFLQSKRNIEVSFRFILIRDVIICAKV